MAARNVVYPNLQMEMLRNKITQEDIEEALHLSRAGVNKKMTGKSEFKLSEAFLIADRFFPGLDVRFMFQRGGDKMRTKSIYRNLVAEMARKGVTTQDIADALWVVRETVSRKITGKTEITLKEAFLIRDTLFPDMGIEMLFRRKEDAQND